jgi:hypothetical protein
MEKYATMRFVARLDFTMSLNTPSGSTQPLARSNYAP